jgi:uncharacterized 2Fe-2S/4Fe-4S cluster protein (DUF4445 family)
VKVQDCHTIRFSIENGGERELAVPSGVSILEAAKKAGIALDAPCGGNGTCGKCRVRIIAGTEEQPESAGQEPAAPGRVHASPGPQSSRHISAEDYAGLWRLACAVPVRSDLTIFVPAAAGAYQSRMKITTLNEGRERDAFAAFRRELEEQGFTAGCGLELLSVNLKAPGPDDSMADRERLLRAAAALIFGTAPGAPASGGIDISLYALRKLPVVLRKSDFSCICVIRRENDGGVRILDIFPAGTRGTPVIAGLAIDIGTTTVAIVLLNIVSGEILASGSAGNGQIRYGADVISRIIESTRPGGLERMRSAVIDDCILPLIKEVCGAAGLEPEQIYRTALAANTTMTHFFTGVPAEHLRLEPYIPAFFQAGGFRGADLGLGIHPDAEIVLAPGIGSYVGGDITAGVFSSMIFKKEGFSLFIDLGTNGELVFGNKDFLLACACSAGPAFEGGDISCGMRAADGAIEACVLDKDDMTPAFTVIGGGKPSGVCGSGLIDLIGELFRCHIINARGKFIREGKRVRRDEWDESRYVAAFAGETEHGREIALTEADIDNFIRAKGAIFSAIRTMLAIVDFSVDAIDAVYIAGGIGSGINVEKAIHIGMLPSLPLERYRYIGNTSLSGAYAMVNSQKVCQQISEISRGITYLELSSHPGYMDEFIAACFLPHTNGELFR